jgi:hypothetical protein
MSRTLNYNVAVFGSGPAGIGAALAAARTGAKTLLVEKLGTLGGQMTSGLVTGLHGYRTHMNADHPGTGCDYVGVDHETKQVVFGIPEEIVDRLRERNAVYLAGDGPAMRTEYDPEALKVILFEMMDEAGVDLMLDTFAFGTVMEGQTIKAVRIANKNGEELVVADQFIDATADGDIAAWAGAPYEIGREGDHRCMALTLYTKFGGVDHQKVLDYLKEHPEELHRGAPEDWQKIYDDGGPVDLKGFKALIMKAFANGDYVLPIGSANEVANPIFIISHSFLPKDQTKLLVDMAYNINCADADDLNRAEIHLRMVQAPMVARFVKKYMPGFENSYLMETAALIGTRESRRIMGEYVLQEDDILNNRRFPDAVARCGRAMNVHSVTGGSLNQISGGQTWIEPSDPQGYDIPLRCLIPKNVENLFVSGRCISVTHMALGSTRGMPVCMATGQAAGSAAALCSKHRINSRALDIKELQDVLRRDRAILD